MRIEILEDIKHDGHLYYKGELREVTEQLGGYFCGLGWAQAADVPIGERDLSPKTLDVHNVSNGLKATELGVK